MEIWQWPFLSEGRGNLRVSCSLGAMDSEANDEAGGSDSALSRCQVLPYVCETYTRHS